VDEFNFLKVKVVLIQQGCDNPEKNAISGDCTKLQ